MSFNFDSDSFTYQSLDVATSNKRLFEAIDLTCDSVYEEDAALFAMMREEMDPNLASLNIPLSTAAETPLDRCFDSDDGLCPVPFDDPTSISILDSDKTPAIDDINYLLFVQF